MRDFQDFVDAQDGVFETALAEIDAGSKEGHWMWFIFPQIDGLGSSPPSRRYALHSVAEARAYLAHPLLGHRLVAIVETLMELPHRDAVKVFGPVDALKLRSCLTLFAAAGGGPLFERALRQWCREADEATLQSIAATS